MSFFVGVSAVTSTDADITCIPSVNWFHLLLTAFLIPMMQSAWCRSSFNTVEKGTNTHPETYSINTEGTRHHVTSFCCCWICTNFMSSPVHLIHTPAKRKELLWGWRSVSKICCVLVPPDCTQTDPAGGSDSAQWAENYTKTALNVFSTAVWRVFPAFITDQNYLNNIKRKFWLF